MAGILTLIRLLFDPRGRMNRSGLLVSAACLLAVELLSALLSLGPQDALPAYLVVAKAIAFWVAAAGTIKRLHDVDTSAWWLVIGIGALCGWSVIVVFLTVMTFGLTAFHSTSSIHIVAFGLIMMPLIGLAFWLHLTPGMLGENRFGPAQDGFGSVVSPSGSQATA